MACVAVALGSCGAREQPAPAPAEADPQAVASLFDALWSERAQRVAAAVTDHARSDAFVGALSEGDEGRARIGAYSALSAMTRALEDDPVAGGPGLAVVVDANGVVVSRNLDINRMVGVRWGSQPLVAAALRGDTDGAAVGMDEAGTELSEGWERVGTAAAAPIRGDGGEVIGALFAAWPIRTVDRWSERVHHDVLLLHGEHRTTNLEPAVADRLARAAPATAAPAPIAIELGGETRVGATGTEGAVRWVLLRHASVGATPREPEETASSPDTAAPTSPPEGPERGGLTVHREGPAPMGDVDVGDENLIGFFAQDDAWRVVVREHVEPPDEPSDETGEPPDDEALHASDDAVEGLTVRQLREGALEAPLLTLTGPVQSGEVLDGAPPWVLLVERGEVSGRELRPGSRARPIFTPPAEHVVRAVALRAERGSPEGVVLTRRLVWPGRERPRAVERVDEHGRREYASVGPRPTHAEVWATWVGSRARPRRLARAALGSADVGGLAAAIGDAGAVASWQTRSDGTNRMTVVRLDARGRERWRREVDAPTGGDPAAIVLTRDGGAVIALESPADRTVAVHGFAPDGSPWPVRRLPAPDLYGVRLLECGPAVSLVTVASRQGPGTVGLTVAQVPVPPSGPLPEPTPLYSVRVDGVLGDVDDAELPPGYEPPEIAPHRVHVACSHGRAAVAFDAPFDEALYAGARRGLVVAEWRVERPSAPPATDAAAPAAPRACSAEPWGGWDGTPACRRAARRSIPGPHRRCEDDDDCVLVGSSCDPHGVSARVAARYQRWTGPCAGPGAGGCAGPSRAVCDSGCCVPDYLGLGAAGPGATSRP